MTNRAQGQGRKASAKQTREQAELRSVRAYGSMARTPAPTPAWSTNPELLPKSPPVRRPEEP